MSLRRRLLLTVAVLVATSLAATAWVSTRITRVELDRLAEAEEGKRFKSELAGLADLLEATEQRRWPTLVSYWRGSFDALLFDAAGLVAASDERYDAASLVASDSGVEGEIRDGERVHAFKLLIPHRRLQSDGRHYRLFLLPPPFAPRDAVAEPFQASAARWTLWLVLGVGLAAFAATATLTRRLAGPLEDLTAALHEGDLSRRIEVRGDDEVARLAEAFNAMAAKIERAERLRRNLVGDVAHELRTPLTNLRGEVESLEDGLLEPTPEVLASLREEVVHLERLVEDLQELALAEAGRLRLEVVSVDLEAEVEGVLRGFGNGASRPRLEARVAPATMVRADRQRLRQILVNLLENARRHTPAQGRVTVSAETSDDTVTIRVRDTGPGISVDRRDDVFERFVRLDGSRQRATGGTGLGLAIVKQLVEAHGGRIRIEDPAGDVGSGTVFTITLPCA